MMALDWNFKDLAKLKRYLVEEAETGRRKIMKTVNHAAGRVQARAKVNVHAKLNTTGLSKGTLARSIAVLPHEETLSAAIGPSVVYGAIHEFGGVIRAVNGPYLHFKTADGAWHMVAQVTIPPRPYLGPALADTIPEIEHLFDTELRASTSSPWPGAID